MNQSASKLTLLLLLFLLSPLLKLHAADGPNDTTYQLLFELNMTKAIQEGIFDPDSGQVYVDFAEPIPDLLLMKGANRVFNGVIQQGLDSGATYHFRFRINDTIYDSIDREATALPGITTISTWWNDDFLNTTTFRIDLTHTPSYVFTIGLDTLEILGDMTDWEPVRIERNGSTLFYDITYHLDPSLLYEYIYRIRRDTLIWYENFGGLNRMFLPPDTTIMVVQYFNNQDTSKILLTLRCHMTIQEELGNFDPETDFLDVAASFNDWGAWDLLYDPYHSGTYQVSKMLDKSLIGGPPVEFRFRINGSWATAELDSLDPRSYVLLPIDTNGNPNTYTCWYNDVGPVPSSPWVTDLFIQGVLEVKQILTGSYLYHNLSGIPEGNSLYKWYRADSVGATLEPIDSAWTINYTLDSIADLGKYIVFEVTPVAAHGPDSIGLPAQVYTTGRIGAVGIPEYAQNQLHLYPNPAGNYIICEGKYIINRFEIFNLSGMLVYSSGIMEEEKIRTDVSQLSPGLYFFRAYTDGLIPVHMRFIKK
ncbi:MAG: T9SS C-terminal target domain-containing protein [Bacteroidetes bacterium]|nr:MAG: T9SS C-terminal target domain-containing protein [Bacteroidota bacterium]